MGIKANASKINGRIPQKSQLPNDRKGTSFTKLKGHPSVQLGLPKAGFLAKTPSRKEQFPAVRLRLPKAGQVAPKSILFL